MEPYKIIRKKLTKAGEAWIVAPDAPPPDGRTWTGECAFVPGDLEGLRKRIEAIKTSFTKEVFPAEGGGWVHAGHNDLVKILAALRQR